MKRATTLIEKAFKENGFKCLSQNLQPLSYVEAGFSGDNITFKLRFISTDDDMDVKVLTENFAKAPKNKQSQVLIVLNQLNKKYNYAKFAMDSDGDITAEYDFPVNTTEELVGKFAVEIAIRMFKIVDEAYNDIMRAIYA